MTPGVGVRSDGIPQEVMVWPGTTNQARRRIAIHPKGGRHCQRQTVHPR
jgi:hypothetical protein